ncbi:alpha/beta hydrolase, partial [Streptomyces scabiei]
PLQHAHPAMLHRGAVSLLADRSPSFLQTLGMLRMPRTLLVGERTEVDLGIVPDDVPIIRVPNAGHSMMSENPEGFVRAIMEGLT